MSDPASRKNRQQGRPVVRRVRFVIRAANHGDVLARVVILFHRLNVEIDALHIARRSGKKTMRLRVTVAAGQEVALRMEAQLYKIVHVWSVETKAERSTGRSQS
jgi:acetolactate synthase small subunit